VDIPLDGRTWRVHAGFADLRAGGLVRYRYDDLRVADRINAWLHHLMLCAGAPDRVAHVTVWHARDALLRLRPCDNAHGVLQTLVRLYRRGLSEPLSFFPKTAWAYVENDDSVPKATQEWQVTPQRPHAEGADASYRLALRGRPDPLGAGREEFHACAHAVFDPLRACLA
jgi:exodeoxyribonuclease V gamma subunit